LYFTNLKPIIFKIQKIMNTNSGLEIKKLKSTIFLPQSGILELHLFQLNSGYNQLGIRAGFETESKNIDPTEKEVEFAQQILNSIEGEGISLISLQKGFEHKQNELKNCANGRTIVCLRGINKQNRNTTFIATNGELLEQYKISLSSEDEKRDVIQGNCLNIFESYQGSISWAVLNCHDYTDITIIQKLLDERIELLLVVSSNPATRLYWHYATSDAHRLFCFIAIANVAEIGGSAAFAPFRKLGKEKYAQISSGGQIFSASGNSEFTVNIPLNIGELRNLRDSFAQNGFNSDKEEERHFVPMYPSQHYLSTFDKSAGNPLDSHGENFIEEVRVDWNLKKIRVAICQLKDIGYKAYIANKYRIRNDAGIERFNQYLSLNLDILERRLSLYDPMISGRKLDFLVFPEVFVPRSFIDTLQKFSNKYGTTIICGVDYPDGADKENANECFILQPDRQHKSYRKITRSQYDAISSDDKTRMTLNRGTKLLRFIDSTGRGYGILVCYDYSHVDILNAINLHNRHEPLELLFIIAYNPYSSLYKSCCIADSHRFYQYIVMCNTAAYGESGIFSPQRTRGEKQVIMNCGRGSDCIAITEIDIDELVAARKTKNELLHGGLFMRKPGIFP
jgi:predicted amidohydrolase